MEADNQRRREIVRLQGVSKVYEEGGRSHAVLQDVDATFMAGEFVVLLGKSGSGKSTLLNLVSGIDAPTHGEIWVNRVQITRLREHERTLFRREHIGFVFQFFNLIPTLTVEENVLLPVELAEQGRAGRERGLELLSRVGLRDRLATYPDRLSGGEQQRVAVARALAHDPLLVLADEPTGNLDEDTGRAVLALLDELTREAGKSLIIATHSLDVLSMADRVFHVRHGALVADEGRPEAPIEAASW